MSLFGSGHINRLLHEQSPYLQQHAQNPVDWFPWGEEAFAKAIREQKPIFLSIGYATCHWCHVMAHESFEDEAIAEQLNRDFVSVKVDREERPDVDQVYMAFLQATTGSGGWPMSVWLTPDRHPIYAGTYFPPADRKGRPSFSRVLERIAKLWTEERETILEKSTEFARHLESLETGSEPSEGVPLDGVAALTVRAFLRNFDARHGGFGGAPKFPRGAAFDFLLREAWQLRGGEEAGEVLDAMVRTVEGMRRGGIQDHLGGGYHRYSVDAAWHVPHFEKMLYDQAQIGATLLDAWSITGWRPFAESLSQLLQYVGRDLRNRRLGGFYSAEDADSRNEKNETREGAYYIWRAEEIDVLLGTDADAVKSLFGVRQEGNVRPESDPHGDLQGCNVLHLAGADDLASTSSQCCSAVMKLAEARRKRPRPALDDKVITAWNGLMIGTCARSSVVLDQLEYLDWALAAARFLRESMWEESTGRLFRSFCRKQGESPAFAEDYAFLAHGLLDLFETTGEPVWLKWAMALQERLDTSFRSENRGGYYTTGEEDAVVVARMITDHDGAEPAASSVAVGNLRRLGALTGEVGWRETAGRVVAGFSATLERSGTVLPRMLAEGRLLDLPPALAILTGDPEDTRTRAIRQRLFTGFWPQRAVIWLRPDNRETLLELLPQIPLAELDPDAVEVRLCESMTCRPPVSTMEELEQLLGPLELRSARK